MTIVLLPMVSGVPWILTGLLILFAQGRSRRCRGVGWMLLGVLMLGIATIAASHPQGPGPAVFALAVAGSVGLAWWGYALMRGSPRGSPAERLPATLAAPTPPVRPVHPEDVVGPWRFYVDAAASMVTVDLKADGRYAQAIVGNRGERVVGPGGTWTLDGPYVELKSYRSAVRGVIERVRWCFGDRQRELALLIKDDPEAGTILVGRKGAVEPMS